MNYKDTLPDGTTGVEICPFAKRHITKEYVNWFHNPLVTKYNSHGLFPYAEEQQETFMHNLKNTINEIVWAIEIFTPLQDAEIKCIYIGTCSLQRIDFVNQSAEFAVVIGNTEYWGKGVCTKVLDMVLKHAFKNLGLNRVWSGTAQTNTGMQKVFDKCGFSIEGGFREGVFLNGLFTDIICYSILAADYFGKKGYE